MKLSLIISSYNQKKRLRFSLLSATQQDIGDNEYEVIVADDNSNDGSVDMIHRLYPDVKISFNKHSKKGKYTLANNWNTAVREIATGDRVIFSNADIVFCKRFVQAHADPVMNGHIIFGPGLSTRPEVGELLNKCATHVEIIREAEEKGWLLPDRHAEGSAYTYNREWDYWFPFGYNFSVMREHFMGVGGFPPIEQWGGEEAGLCKKIKDKYHCKILSNVNAYAIHLWHPVVNFEGITEKKEDYRF